ncbi:uncharacterized protein LOC103512519 isoform X3 [Diaphorina citri]|uniref:Uncharacterized protein LOC103512519 isoform X3 n=1 Tax=Diaphorina citri TaxID=121845 RepID=A0A3Q0IZX8_DIACI|nr:uncharacterized protein LOC103512519 isoform X3 [Diaphorina citri]
MRDSFSNTKDTMNENLEAADDYNPEKDLSNAKTDPDNNNNIQRNRRQNITGNHRFL